MSPSHVQGQENDATPLIPPMPAWRREVQDRVDAYRARRPPAHATPSAPNPIRVLPFRPQPVAARMACSGAEPLADPVLPPGVAATVAARADVAARAPAPASDAACLQLPLPMAANSTAVPAPALPLALAPRGLRLQAAITDALVVGTAAVLFALAGWSSQGFAALTGVPWRPLLPALIAVPAVLAALYLLLCTYAGEGATIGMRCCGLMVAGLDGPLTPAAQRRRGWASVLSLAALGLGFAWIWCDPQQLSWHDMISRTCVVMASLEE
ncbi:MAG: RDD family protein [Terriglobales bacterium]